MTYDGLVLAAVVAELDSHIRRGRVQKIRQHSDTELTIEIRSIGRTHSLFMSAESRFPRVYLTASRHPSPPEAPQFCMLLRKHLMGAFVKSVEQVGMDRIMRIRLDSREHGESTLVMEIMGKHSNLILIDPDGRILGAIKHVGSSVSRYRQILPGREYLPPPGADKVDIREISPTVFDGLWESGLPEAAERRRIGEWLVASLAGFGPFLAEEILRRAELDGSICKNRVREEILQLGEIVKNQDFSPTLITDDKGGAIAAYPLPSMQFPSDHQHQRESINEALDILFRSLVSRTALDDERTQLITTIRRAHASRRQALKSIERTVLESGRADRYRQLGELLISSLHLFEKGAKSLRLIDYFDPETPEIEVELDEKLSPQQNAERYFRRYQKARDAAGIAVERRERVNEELSALTEAEQDALGASSVEDLRELRGMLTRQGLLRSDAPQKESGREEFDGHRIRRLTTPDGWEVLYGETAQANDHLTQRIARPNDVWLHARAVTGAHVVIRTAGHAGAPPQSVLKNAAVIAARNSQARHSSLVPVDHTLRKYVRKPRGSAPGFVIYSHEKTIDIGTGD